MRTLVTVAAITLLTVGCGSDEASPGGVAADSGAQVGGASAAGGRGGGGGASMGGSGAGGAAAGGSGGSLSAPDAGDDTARADANGVDVADANGPDAGDAPVAAGACAGKTCGQLCNSCPPSAPQCPGAIAFCSQDGQCVIGPPPTCGATGDAGASSDAVTELRACLYPHPLVIGNKGTGFEACDNGVYYRLHAVDCPSLLPRANPKCAPSGSPGGGGDEPCMQDSDCKKKPLGRCAPTSGHLGGCGCLYGCTRDADCGAGQICECGDPTGLCRPAGCTDDKSCPAGSHCASVSTTFGGCSWTPPVRGYQCLTKGDSCTVDTNCSAPTPACAFTAASGVRSCHEGQLDCP